MTKLKTRLREHPLFRMLFALQGNPRICVLTEPLWGIPYNLYAPYVGLYMAALGLSDYRIGLVATFGAFFQMFGALFGGIVTDKLGRRRTTFIFDFISWSIPALIWMCAQNFWWFFAAVVFNSMWQVTDNAWSCLLVEDCDPKKLVDVYTWVNVSGLLAVFFAPISSLLVGTFSVVPAVRFLYGVTFVMMTTKFIILYKYCTETGQGRVRLRETKGVSVWKMMGGYRHIFVQILRSPATLAVLALKVLINITQMINTNFFGLYVTRGLGLPPGFVALFPMVRAGVMLLFIFTIQHRLNRMKYRPVMMAGAGLYLVANALLLFTTGLSLWLLVPYILMDAFSCALLIPRQDSLMVLFVDQQERARTLGLMFVITLGFTSPFGALVGRLSELDMKLPFVLNTAIFAMILLLVLLCKPLKEHDERQQAESEEEAMMPAQCKELGFAPADILLPQNCDLSRWPVVACDQFTAQPDYWQRVADQVGDAPSTLRLILPEAQLAAPDVEEKIAAIHSAMADYLAQERFRTLADSLVYVERTQSDGRVRHGLIGRVDLEQYDFTPGSGARIRATEGTVLERIPPRARVRRGAPIELPHVMLLIDDPSRTVIEPLSAATAAMEPLYDLELMENGGRLQGWRLTTHQMTPVMTGLAALATPQAMEQKYGMGGAAPLLFAVGDGNHSLATAKACWEEQKKGLLLLLPAGLGGVSRPLCAGGGGEQPRRRPAV